MHLHPLRSTRIEWVQLDVENRTASNEEGVTKKKLWRLIGSPPGLNIYKDENMLLLTEAEIESATELCCGNGRVHPLRRIASS